MGNKSKKMNKGLTNKQQDKMLTDLTLMTAVSLAYMDYVKSINKEEEAKNYVQDWLNKHEKKEGEVS